jgi:FkbM family methyltransferase
MSAKTGEPPYGTGIVPLLPPAVRRARILAWQQIDVVLDVGANAGQYGSALRRAGFGGRIVSFEPLTEAFARLAAMAEHDPLWDCRQLALGAQPGPARLNVSADLEASSMLPMEERHVRHWPPSAYVGVEDIAVERLDSIAPTLGLRDRRTYLKLDVQGYELEVLRGAETTLDCVCAIEAELSLVALYGGGPLLEEVVQYVDCRGFELVSIEGITEEPETGQMLQLDGIFVRPSSSSG